MISNNNYHLPSSEGSGQLEETERERVKELSLRHALLDITETYNSGSGTVLLVSTADGRGDYDRFGSLERILAGQRLAHKLGQLGCQDTEIIISATSADLKDAIQDTEIANIFLLGHGSYHSWVASDGSVDWYQAGKMVEGHLKKGVFANLGCGAVHSWNFIPLGRYVIRNKGVLLGKSKDLAYIDEMTDLSRYEVIK